MVGIQNAEGSTLMTLADMSVITAEVKVDETDIVHMALGQSADVTVDALPGRIFKGHVTEVGDQALLRTTGIATSQSTTGTEEAKDFKVVVTLDQSPDNHLEDLRPGLSTTAKITVAQRPNALTIPIQALVQRDPGLEKILDANGGQPPKTSPDASSIAPVPPHFVQGIYILSNSHRQAARRVPPRRHWSHRRHRHRGPLRPHSGRRDRHRPLPGPALPQERLGRPARQLHAHRGRHLVVNCETEAARQRICCRKPAHLFHVY